mmetsp:Transcript_3210/g.4343  ORF Transcript_3210/g.4343 Transcript_3210/m.4343 type:complete len:80 (+) Transcript_3210:364-603(+)|eukprot:CAMPEP_0170462856 /NCGR_PEP_ID=MMETSP0123-20130129/8192_1 /TAXON_ID=182087 /ORGANISM="Favella ehrenbergii, Strain Fehren 1" /LENGTH=79 /DNA_ID=CAMNT_0010728155 /DNA_START=377 /DNA_END=616 /DNA_ORIENTATION=+
MDFENSTVCLYTESGAEAACCEFKDGPPATDIIYMGLGDEAILRGQKRVSDPDSRYEEPFERRRGSRRTRDDKRKLDQN